MVNELVSVLKGHIDDPRFGEIVNEAIGIISSSTVKEYSLPKSPSQSAKSVAEIHAFRKRSGYYAKASIVGLETTIAAMSNSNDAVRIGSIVTDTAIVCFWLGEVNNLAGIVIFRLRPPPTLL